MEPGLRVGLWCRGCPCKTIARLASSVLFLSRIANRMTSRGRGEARRTSKVPKRARAGRATHSGRRRQGPVHSSFPAFLLFFCPLPSPHVGKKNNSVHLAPLVRLGPMPRRASASTALPAAASVSLAAAAAPANSTAATTTTSAAASAASTPASGGGGGGGGSSSGGPSKTLPAAASQPGPSTPASAASAPAGASRPRRIMPSRSRRGGPGVGISDVDTHILETLRRRRAFPSPPSLPLPICRAARMPLSHPPPPSFRSLSLYLSLITFLFFFLISPFCFDRRKRTLDTGACAVAAHDQLGARARERRRRRCCGGRSGGLAARHQHVRVRAVFRQARGHSRVSRATAHPDAGIHAPVRARGCGRTLSASKSRRCACRVIPVPSPLIFSFSFSFFLPVLYFAFFGFSI
jgi:hypothetical protein